MILFLNEERAYRHWVTHHRQGFVVDGRYRSKNHDWTLHRATCDAIKSRTQHSHDTTRGRIKACSLDPAELRQWTLEENGSAAVDCDSCRPTQGLPAAAEPEHLTRLQRDILDYIVESAAIHLEWPDGPGYRLTVSDIAACMGKTLGQLNASLQQLSAGGWIQPIGKPASSTAFRPAQLILPTVAAIVQSPGFESEDPQQLQSQIDHWNPDAHSP